MGCCGTTGLAAEPRETDCILEDGADLSPTAWVQLNLLCIKQFLKRADDLTDEQRQVISQVTGEDMVTSKTGAQNALVRLFGKHDSDDRSPQSVQQLRSIDSKLGQIRAALGMQPCSAPPGVWATTR